MASPFPLNAACVKWLYFVDGHVVGLLNFETVNLIKLEPIYINCSIYGRFIIYEFAQFLRSSECVAP